MTERSSTLNHRNMLLICAAILLGGGLLTVLIFTTEPTAERSGATRQTAMLVDVQEVERGTYRPEIRAMGTVEPARDIVLSPRVTGEVMEVAPAFVPGGEVAKGDILLKIDPADFRNRLEQRRSELQQAQAELKLEEGQADVARRDYQLLDESLSGENEALVLREPQLEAARAQVASARAAVDQAELDLQRATIRAPFDARILTRGINVGSQVAPGNDLARLVGLDTYWVAATVSLSHLRWLRFPEEDGEGSPVEVRNRTAWAPEESRDGTLFRLVGNLEEDTRMARVLVTVDDPLARREANAGDPALILGAFVEAVMQGKPLRDVVRLDRDYLRQDDTVWLMRDGELAIQPVRVLMRDAKFAYITDGLEGGEQVVTTNLATVSEGAPLRLSSEQGDRTAPEEESS